MDPPSGPAADGHGDAQGKDAKAGNQGPAGSVDPRILIMVTEAFRHAKAIGGWGSAAAVLATAGLDEAAAGIVLGDPGEVVPKVSELLTEHRVWKRLSVPGTNRRQRPGRAAGKVRHPPRPKASYPQLTQGFVPCLNTVPKYRNVYWCRLAPPNRRSWPPVRGV